MNCPECGKKWIAEIIWGYVDMEGIEARLEKRDLVLGGCIVSDNDPRWECNYCHYRWGKGVNW